MSYHYTVQQIQVQQNQVHEEPIGISLSKKNIKRIKETNKFKKRDKTKKDHRQRLQEMIKFIEKSYPTYSRECVKELTLDELSDETYDFYDSKKDFIYEHLNSGIIKAFMASKKVKKFVLPKSLKAQRKVLAKNPEKKDKIMSYDHIRKYHDAILFGSK